MIVKQGGVILGRGEAAEETVERLTVEHVSRALSVAHDLLRRQAADNGSKWFGPDATEEERKGRSSEEKFWDAWNVVAAVGSWGSWSLYSLLRVPELGVHPAPAVVQQYVYVPAKGVVMDSELPTGANAPVLHQTTKLLHPKRWPISGVSVSYAERALEGLTKVEQRLEELLLHVRPDTQTVAGVKRALRQDNLRLTLPPVRGGPQRKYRTYKMVRDETPAESYLSATMKGNMRAEVPSEDKRDPSRWESLDEALRELV
jgi:hypothetical protein